MEDIQLAAVPTNGIKLHVAQAGQESGPLMILLHGFPEFWYSWSKHIPPLASDGFRVWTPDQRGYNRSDKPPKTQDYRLERLADDIIGLIDAANREQAILVGHDWGGAVAWWVAHNFPERVKKLVIINVPHPLVIRKLIRTSFRQLLRSWYVFAIQIPGLVDWAARRHNWQSMVDSMRASSLPGTFTDQDFEELRAAWSQPGAFTAMLNWYRAGRYRLPEPRHERIQPPTLILWGKKDKFIGPEGATKSLAMCESGELVFYDDNDHWLQHERPAEIVERINQFCRE